MNLKNLLIVLLIGWALVRGGLLYLAWTGDPDPGRRAQVLRHFTEDDIARGETYSRSGFGARALSGYVYVLFLLVLIGSGVWPAWCDRLDRWAGGGFLWPNVAQILAAFALTALVMLPFQYYLGHICETRMGFSNMTAGAWFLRYGKGLLVGWLMQGIGVLLVLALVRWVDRWWPLVLPIGGTLFGVVVTLLFPLVITPLFYEQTPLPDGPLRERIMAIASQTGVPVENIYQIDESRYSKHTNAYFTGLFGRRRIVLYDTLIKSHTVEEAALIFAHEVGHWLHDHMFKGLALGFVGMAFGSWLLWWGFPLLAREPAFGLGPLWSARNLPFFWLLMTIGQLYTAPIEAQISQHFERQADLAGLKLTGLHEVFIGAKVRLARDNHQHLLPHPWRVFWLFSHPPSIDRIAMAEQARADMATPP
jgi:STE24 endopeptidase